MMRSKAIVFLLVTTVTIVKAQNKKINSEPEPLVARKTIQFGFQTSFGGGFNEEGGHLMSTYKFNPKISYFIANRISLGIGYVGVSSNMQPTRRNSFYHSGELELKYYFNNRSRTLFYSQVGILYGQYRPTSFNSVFNNNGLGTTLKIGGGVTWRLKNHPNLAVNMELNNYFNLGDSRGSRFKFAPNLSVGFSYYIPHKKKKVISEQQKQLGGL